MDHCIIVFNPAHFWVIDAKAGVSLYFIGGMGLENGLRKGTSRMPFALFPTVLLHKRWVPVEAKIRVKLNIRNVRIYRLIYSDQAIPLSYEACHYMLNTYPAPRPMSNHIIHIPPCIASLNYKYIITYLESRRPLLNTQGLKYFTTYKGDWFLSIFQVDWALLHLKNPKMNTLYALSAQAVNPESVPAFLKTNVNWYKRQFLLRLIQEWRG